jgi:hypothetical protein
MIMGDLKTQSFEEIWNSRQSDIIRDRVKNCSENCWMTGTAVPAMRRNPIKPVRWVLNNKLRIMQGKALIL